MDSNEQFIEIVNISKKICNILGKIYFKECSIKDSDGLYDIDFSFNNSNDCNPVVSNFKSFLLGIIEELKELVNEEERLYNELSDEEISLFLHDLFSFKYLFEENEDKSSVFLRIQNRLLDRIILCDLDDEDLKIIKSVLLAIEIESFRIKRDITKQYTEEMKKKANGKPICKDISDQFTFFRETQVRLKYFQLNKHNFIEKKALDANFDVYSINAMSPYQVNFLLSNLKNKERIYDFLIQHIISFYQEINSLLEYFGLNDDEDIIRKFDNDTMAVNSFHNLSYIQAFINCMPKDLLEDLIERFNLEFGDNQSNNNICNYIRTRLKNR